MADGFGRNEILSVIAGGALAVPALLAAAGVVLAMGNAPAISKTVGSVASMGLPGGSMAKPAPRPTPMAVPHPPRVPGAHARAPAVHHAATKLDHAAPKIGHAAHAAPPMPHAAAPAARDPVVALRIEHDAFAARTTYTDPATNPADRSASGIHCYVVQADDHGAPQLRLRVRYVNRAAATHIDIEGLYFHVDGKRYAIDNPPYGLLEVQRDVSVTAEQAWEWYDTDVDRKRLALLRAIAAGRTAVIRYDGREGQAKHVVTAAEKAAITRVLAAYEALKSAGGPASEGPSRASLPSGAFPPPEDR